VDDLISAIRNASTRIPTMAGEARVYPPASAHEVEQIEDALGSKLPVLWRRIYLEVGNGGFGPGYGLTGLISGAKDDQGDSALDLYRIFCQPDPEEPTWHWPEGVLPVCHWGCAIQSCIDSRDPAGGVIRFDPNPYGGEVGWDGAWRVEAPSAEAWWRAWVDGTLKFKAGAA
jgi:hypothetical protein